MYFKKYFLFYKSIMTNIIYPEKFLPLPFSRLLFFFFIIHKSLNYFFIFTSYCNIFIQYFIFFFFIFIPYLAFCIFKITIILINFVLRLVENFTFYQMFRKIQNHNKCNILIQLQNNKGRKYLHVFLKLKQTSKKNFTRQQCKKNYSLIFFFFFKNAIGQKVTKKKS